MGFLMGISFLFYFYFVMNLDLMIAPEGLVEGLGGGFCGEEEERC